MAVAPCRYRLACLSATMPPMHAAPAGHPEDRDPGLRQAPQRKHMASFFNSLPGKFVLGVITVVIGLWLAPKVTKYLPQI